MSEEGVSKGMCVCVDVQVCMCVWGQDALGFTEAAANVHTVFAKQVICFPGFVFLLSVGCGPSLETKGT